MGVSYYEGRGLPFFFPPEVATTERLVRIYFVLEKRLLKHNAFTPETTANLSIAVGN